MFILSFLRAVTVLFLCRSVERFEPNEWVNANVSSFILFHFVSIGDSVIFFYWISLNIKNRVSLTCGDYKRVRVKDEHEINEKEKKPQQLYLYWIKVIFRIIFLVNVFHGILFQDNFVILIYKKTCSWVNQPVLVP